MNIELKEYYHRRYLRQKPEFAARSKAYYEANKEKVKAYSKKWYQENREHCLARQKESSKRWYSENWNKKLFYAAKHTAKSKNLEFNLCLEDIVIPDLCPIFGWKLTKIQGYPYRDTNASLDRKDSSRGYTKDNIWVISGKANYMKQDATEADLVAFAIGVLNYYVH